MLLAAAVPAQAQPAGTAASDTTAGFGATPSAEAVRVIDRRIRGEREGYSSDDLLAFVRTRENHGLFGIRGLTPGYWLWRLGASGRLPAWLSGALTRAGEPPAVLDTAVVATDAERLAAFYRQAGFRQADVAAEIDTLGAGRARVTFRLAPGVPSMLDTVQYAGIDTLAAATQQAILEESVLDARLAEDAPRRLVAEGQRFAEADLFEERRRLIDALQRRGHALVGRDSIRAVVFGADDDAEADTVDLRFEIRPGPWVRFGDVEVVVEGPERAALRVDTMALGAGEVVTRIEDEARLEPFLLRRALRFAPGDPYDIEALRATKQRLERIGVIGFSEITAHPLVRPDSAEVPVLPHRIRLRTRPRHSVRLEGFVLQRSYLLGTERDELGLGAGVTYRNVNAFGSGEVFSLSTSGSVAGSFDAGFPTAQLDVGATLTYPYLIRPLGGLERSLRLTDARTRFALRALTARRDLLRILIRSRVELGAQLELQHTRATASLIDVLDFNLSDPDTLRGFDEEYLRIVQDPVERAFLLEDYTRPQVNNALRYTLRSATANLFRRDRGYIREVSLEAGGNLPYLLDEFVFTPDTLEGTIPSIVDGADLEYRPYARLRADVRQYLPVTRRSTVALKGIVGVALPTGDAPVVPFDRRFYIGGATSVRGWELRTLGPGASRQDGAFVQGGDIKLELSAEARSVLVRDLFEADWSGALFVDAGNVWTGPRNPADDAGRFFADEFYRQLGVSAGYGLRIGWEFLIVRFDLAYKVRRPQPGSPWFPDGLRTPLFHFGIGQAF